MVVYEGVAVSDFQVYESYPEAAALNYEYRVSWSSVDTGIDKLVGFSSKNVVLSSCFVPIDTDNKTIFVNQTYSGYQQFFKTRFSIIDGRYRLECEPIFSPGKHVVIGGPIDGVWYHWLFNWCPRLLLLQHLSPERFADPDVRFVVHPAAMTEPFRAVLDTFGIPTERLLPVDPACDYRLEDAYLVSFLDQSKLYPELVRSFARHVKTAFDLTMDPAAPLRIFASRQDLPAPKRRIANFEALRPVLDRHGLRLENLGRLAAREQARLFHEAELVVGGHGSDLSNLLFCRPGTSVLVIESQSSVDKRENLQLEQICEILDLKYRLIVCAVEPDPSSPHKNADYIVDVEKIDRLMSDMMRDSDKRCPGGVVDGAGPADMRAYFNDYVRRVFPERRRAAGADWRWPGDEWADPALQEATWRRIAGPAPQDLREIVEIGPGAGKYTALALARTPAHVTAFEISDAFLLVLGTRFAEVGAGGRLDARLIDWSDNEGLMRAYGARAGTADLWFAIDVLMMMDFQSALVYLISAATMLRPGGRLIATFADGGSASGLTRMLRDTGRHSAFDAAPCTRFHWIDRSLLEGVLPSLGFGDLAIEHGPDGGLDIARLYVTATLVDPEAGRALAGGLAPVGDSTNRWKPTPG